MKANGASMPRCSQRGALFDFRWRYALLPHDFHWRRNKIVSRHLIDNEIKYAICNFLFLIYKFSHPERSEDYINLCGEILLNRYYMSFYLKKG